MRLQIRPCHVHLKSNPKVQIGEHGEPKSAQVYVPRKSQQGQLLNGPGFLKAYLHLGTTPPGLQFFLFFLHILFFQLLFYLLYCFNLINYLFYKIQKPHKKSEKIKNIINTLF